MAAYILALVEVTDAEAYKAYSDRTPGVIAQYGGRFLVRGGGERRILEGAWPESRTVIIEFPDRAAAERFYDSRDYQDILPLRQAASRGRLCLLDGV